jgi:uncharacterized protein (DUF1697 family)
VTGAGGATSVRYVAFLRAINVGGHVVTMARLREIFEAMGHSRVDTFIASGNVFFHPAGRAAAAAMEAKIAAALKKALGYDVATFLRTAEEVAAIAERRPFPIPATSAPGASLYVGFLAAPLPPAARKTLLAMRGDVDDLHLHGREVYWLGRRGFHEAEFSPARMERSLKIEATFRNITTVRKIAARLAVSP